jgi:hypothetical protein
VSSKALSPNGDKLRPRKRAVTIAFRSNDPNPHFLCKLDRRKPASCKSPKTYRNLRPGRHRFEIWAIAADGNKDPTPAVARFRFPMTRQHHRAHKRRVQGIPLCGPAKGEVLETGRRARVYSLSGADPPWTERIFGCLDSTSRLWELSPIEKAKFSGSVCRNRSCCERPGSVACSAVTASTPTASR